MDESGDATANGYVNAVNLNTGYQLNGVNALSYPTNDSGGTGASIAVGPGALSTQYSLASAGYSNTAMGYYAMGGGQMTTSSTANVAVGYEAAYTTSSSTTCWTAVGYKAAYFNPFNAPCVTAIGYEADYTAPGDEDVAVGYQALYSGSGGNNVAIGYQAAKYTTSPSGGDLAAGYNALATTASAQSNMNSGNNQTAVGAFALQNVQGSSNSNSALGYDAGGSISTGSNNTVFGYEVASTTLTTGSNNILIGTTSAVDTLTATTSNFVSIGNLYEGDANIGHVVFHGSTPTVSSGSANCGTSPSIAGNDNVGVVTVGSSTNGSICTITFANAWTTAPVCMAQDQTTANLLYPVVTTTTVAITGTLTAGDKISYRCFGYQL